MQTAVGRNEKRRERPRHRDLVARIFSLKPSDHCLPGPINSWQRFRGASRFFSFQMALEAPIPPLQKAHDDELVLDLEQNVARLLEPSLERSMLRQMIQCKDRTLLDAARAASDPKDRAKAVLKVASSAATDAAHEDWTRIFTGFSDAEGKRLAVLGKAALTSPELGRSLTYGEVSFHSFAMILEMAQPLLRGGLFVDLGHGTGLLLYAMFHHFTFIGVRNAGCLRRLQDGSGHSPRTDDLFSPCLFSKRAGAGRAVLAAALLRGRSFREFRGLEIIPTLVDASRETLRRFKERVAERPGLYSDDGAAPPLVTLFQGDILAGGGKGGGPERGRVSCTTPAAQAGPSRDPAEAPDAAWTDGDLIFVNSTCFSKDLMVGSRFPFRTC